MKSYEAHRTNHPTFPINLLRQAQFCPRIPYFSHLVGLRSKSPLWVEQGSDHHNLELKRIKRRSLERYGIENPKFLRNVFLESKSIGVHGLADGLIIGTSKGCVVEFKLGKQSIHKGAMIQLNAYAMIAEEQFGIKFEHNFFVVEKMGKMIPVPLTERSRKQVLEARDSLLRILNSPLLPQSPATPHQCGQCEYLWRCNDRNW